MLIAVLGCLFLMLSGWNMSIRFSLRIEGNLPECLCGDPETARLATQKWLIKLGLLFIYERFYSVG
jgi:hypothetical protein